MTTTTLPPPPRCTAENPSHMNSHERAHYYGGPLLLARSSRTPWRYHTHDFSTPSSSPPERQDMLPCFSHSLCFESPGSDIWKLVLQVCQEEGDVIEAAGVFKLGYMTRGAQRLRLVFLIKADAETTRIWEAQNAVDGSYRALCEAGMGSLEVEIMDG